jgi:threonine synthase
MTTVSHLECSLCGRVVEKGRGAAVCECGGAAVVRYDLERARATWHRGWVEHGPSTMWRYSPLLPVTRPESIVSLGEGFTPLVRARRLHRALGCEHLWIKDEGLNPTGSFHARGMSCAISMAVDLGVRRVAVASAGNAGAALAAYAASAGLEAHVFMPRHAPEAGYVQCRALGARVTLVDGRLADCARLLEERRDRDGLLDLGAFGEPYRIEGVKTMGLEVAEQMQWRLPDAILLPAGGGAGIAGIWKSFEELALLGWISPGRPKLIAVHTPGRPPEDRLAVEALKASGGAAVPVDPAEALDAGRELAEAEGLFAAPLGAACAAALRQLLRSGLLKPGERIVICQTAAGLKYLPAWSARFPRPGGEEEKLGGLITPR